MRTKCASHCLTTAPPLLRPIKGERAFDFQQSDFDDSTNIPSLVRALPRADSTSTPEVPESATRCVKELFGLPTEHCIITLHLGAKGDHHWHGELPPARTNAKGCWLHQGRQNEVNGYISVRSMRSPTFLSQQRVHLLAVMAWHERGSVKRLLDRKTEVSHRCHEVTCFNPDHLVVETHRENVKRMQCNRRLACICQGVPDCIFDIGRGDLLYNKVEAIG